MKSGHKIVIVDFMVNNIYIKIPVSNQYLMGHSDISVTMNTYTHLGYEDAKDEMVRVEELESAKVELQKVISDKTISKKMFKVV